MSQILHTDPKIFRSIIMFQFLRKNSVEETYKSMCEAMGNGVDYSEVDYWYYRFHQGNFDLEYDRSLDPPPVTLSTLPVDILPKIVQKSDWKERLVTRKVCTGFRAVIDQHPVDYENVEVKVYDSNVEVTYNNVMLIYKQDEEDCLIRSRSVHQGFPVNGNMKVENANFVDLAFQDLSIALQNSKMKRFEVVLQAEKANSERFHDWLLKSVKMIHVTRAFLQVASFQIVLSILKLLEPGKLEKMKLDSRRFSAPQFMRIVEMEQWKQAKEVIIDKSVSSVPNQFQHFYHFKRFTVAVSSMTSGDAVHLLNALSNSVNFESCDLKFSRAIQNRTEISRVIGGFVGQLDLLDEIFHRRSIHGSKDFLKITISKYEFKIRRESS